MTHEFKNLLTILKAWQKNGVRAVLATVVALEGSSYRRPGVRMLLSETGEMEGAVSGGCVEKEILQQSQTVVTTGIPKVITYDGRFRLGCEGVLYILLEPIEIAETLDALLQNCFKNRISFQAKSYFNAEFSTNTGFGTVLTIEGKNYPLHSSFSLKENKALQVFTQEFKPIFQLYIFGAEHDAVQLCALAANIGFEVHIIAAPDEQKTIDYFKGATSLSSPLVTAIDVSGIGENTAVVLMSHSLSKDVQYLLALKDARPAYFGLLGPSTRRELLFAEFLERYPDTPSEFFETMHGPTGLDIGAETASEIALSIVAEIVSVTRKAALMPLREKLGKIHE